MPPRDLLELRLIQAWEDVFNKRPISITDNFFDIGGHSLLAVRLVAQVKEKLRRVLPLSALVQGASVESLAEMLRRQEGGAPDSPLVAIQPLGNRSPLFCVHPIGGNILCYVQLGRGLGSERPLYGLQAFGDNQKLDQIDSMAAHYISQMRIVQPEGPYILGGWSFGGVVAFEMARQLEQQQQDVGALILIDSWATRHSGEQYDHADLLARFIADTAGIAGKPASLHIDGLRTLDHQEQMRCLLNQAISLGILPRDLELSHFSDLFDVFCRNVKALQGYSPSRAALNGRVVLFRSIEGKNESADGRTLGWDRLIEGSLDVRDAAGDHYSMLTGFNGGELAQQVTAYLNAADIRQPE